MNFNQVFQNSLKWIITFLNEKFDNLSPEEKPLLNEQIYKLSIGICNKFHPEYLKLLDSLFKLRASRITTDFELQYIKEGKLKVTDLTQSKNFEN